MTIVYRLLALRLRYLQPRQDRHGTASQKHRTNHAHYAQSLPPLLLAASFEARSGDIDRKRGVYLRGQ